MTDGTKRTIEELITLHEVEPELSEVITEGRTDAALILWFLRRQGSGTAVYSISDRLDVSAATVRNAGQNVGNKGRVVAAALKISEESLQAAQKITFVYDIDDDVMAERSVPDAECLLHTDYRSIEMYCFTKSPVDKMLKITLRAPDELVAKDILDAITEPLVDVAFARFALSRASTPIAMIKAIERRFNVRSEIATVDVRSLISDSVNDAGGERKLGVSKATLVADYEHNRAQNTADVRLVIRGHDFTRICCFYLKSRFPSIFREDRNGYKTPEVFEGALIACLEANELASEELFKKLLSRHGASEA